MLNEINSSEFIGNNNLRIIAEVKLVSQNVIKRRWKKVFWSNQMYFFASSVPLCRREHWCGNAFLSRI